MAKLEIPSIVVQSNCYSNPKMKKQGTLRAQRSLPKQSEFEEEELLLNSSPSMETNLSQSEQMISTAGDTELVSNSQSFNNTPPINNTAGGGSVSSGGGPPQRIRTHNKVKLLVRSQAIRESTSPPRDPHGCTRASPIPVVHSTTNEVSPPPLQSNPPNSNNNYHTHTLAIENSSLRTNNHYSPEVTSTTTSSAAAAAAAAASQENLTTSHSICVPTEINGDIMTPNEDDKEYNSNPSPLNTSNNKITKSTVKVLTNQRQKFETNTITVSCQNCSEQNCSNCNGLNVHRTINNNNLAGNNNITNNAHNTLTVCRANNRNKLKHQNSSSFDSASASPCLSRESSTEQYTDTTGVNLDQFILETLNKNAKDRMLMLNIEQELVTLAKDKIKNHFKFPPMSSYQRMLVHRCAAYFGMDHNVESSGKCVVVNKTKSTRIPDLHFKEHIREDLLFPDEPRRSILKRDCNSFEESFKSPDRQLSMENRRSKSFEEREEEYEKVRRRIFNREHMQDCSSQEELAWTEIPWSSSDSENSSRMRLLHPDSQSYRSLRLIKGQSVETNDTLRPCVSKSYSFGGYTGSVSLLSRGDSVTSTHSAGPRLLTKQDSAASSTLSWRLSPSSSGYKSQSQRSDSVTPSPTATPYPSGQQTTPTDDVTNPPSVSMSWDEQSSPCNNQPPPPPPPMVNPQQPTRGPPPNQLMWMSYSNRAAPNEREPPAMWNQAGSNYAHHAHPEGTGASPPMDMSQASTNEPNTVMWAVTDLHSVPKGSVLIDPQTSQPFTNPDGSIYHFDPTRPPPSLILPPQGPSYYQNRSPSQQSFPGVQYPTQPAYNIQNNNFSSCPNINKSGPMPRSKNSPPPTTPPYTQKQYSSSSPSVGGKKQSSPGPPTSNSPTGNGTTLNKKTVNISPSNPPVPAPVKPLPTSGTNGRPETTQSPKRLPKSTQKLNTKPTTYKSTFTNTATSPSLPFTPPIQVGPYGNQTSVPGYQYLPNSQFENISNLPIQPFSVNYAPSIAPSGMFGPTNMVPTANAAMQIYNDDTQLIYSYGGPAPNQYNRMDPSMADLSGYFVNLNLNGDIAGPVPNNTQQVAYQGPTSYWSQQPMVYYVPPTNGSVNQRYSVPLVQGQQGGYISAYGPPQGNGGTGYPTTMTPGGSMVPATNTDLSPMYHNAQAPMVYGPGPAMVQNGSAVALTTHMQSQPPSIVFATGNQGPTNTIMYSPNAPPPLYAPTHNIMYATNTATSQSSASYSSNTNYAPKNAMTSSSMEKPNSYRYTALKYSTPPPKNHSRGTPNTASNQTHSNPSSTNSSSPANTIVPTYYQSSPGPAGAVINRHCSPADTPPNMPSMPMNYGCPQYPQGYGPMQPPIAGPQSTMVYRNSVQMGVRASPPLNHRTSRSPTPGTDQYDRNNRLTPMLPVVYQSVPCIASGDVRYMSPRQQTPSYRNTSYNRPPSFPQTFSDSTLGRPPKVKKFSRSKTNVPLPPGGR